MKRMLPASLVRGARALALSLVATLALAACEKPSPAVEAVEDATPSPNASLLPEPLASAPSLAEQPELAIDASAARVGIPADSSGRLILPADAAAPIVPEPMRSGLPLEADSTKERELAGVTLEAEWRWSDLPQPPKGAEVNGVAIEIARKLTALKWTVDLADAGRMRVLFNSRAMPIAPGSELRGRFDRFGHVLVWPNGDQYRVLPPGAVRTLVGERRVDVVPLLRPILGQTGEGGRRLGLATRRADLSTKTGKLTLEQAKVADAGLGGPLLCRLLAEMIAIDPSVAPCAPGEVPLRALFTWPNGGSISFEVLSLVHRLDLPSGQLLVPPPAAGYTSAGLPPNTTGVFLTRDELVPFRSKPLDIGPASAPGAPGEGFLAFNGTDLLRYVFVDGVPVALVAPGQERYVIGPPRGRYVVAWRSFLGDVVEPPKTVELPARLTVGLIHDAGAPPPRDAKQP